MILAIAGISGSGKTTVVKKLMKILGKNNVSYLHLDSYYKDQSQLPLKERENINYDHPNAIDFELFLKHLKLLAEGKSIETPIYDFTNHTREKRFKTIIPKKIIIIEGIHALTHQYIRKLAEIKVYIDIDADISFIRRLIRDTKERGRTVESVIKQYVTTVKPMQEKHVVPTKQYADFIIDGNRFNIREIENLANCILGKINNE